MFLSNKLQRLKHEKKGIFSTKCYQLVEMKPDRTPPANPPAGGGPGVKLVDRFVKMVHLSTPKN